MAIETARRAAENFANRGFAAVKETTDVLSEQFEGYAESITPVSVQTMQTIVGDESLIAQKSPFSRLILWGQSLRRYRQAPQRQARR